MKVNKYQDLIVWQKAMDFAEKVYGLTRKFPSEENFGMSSQIKESFRFRQTSPKVPEEIQKRNFHSFYQSQSCFEAETQIMLANRIGLMKEQEIQPLIEL